MEPFSPAFTTVPTKPFAVWRTLYRQRWQLVGALLLGGCLGLLVSWLLPERYTSTILLLPELQSDQALNLSQVRELAESVGFALDSKPTVEAVRPDLYPDVIESTPFALSVLHQTVKPKAGNPRPLFRLLTGATWFAPADSVGQLPLPTARPIRLTTKQRALLDDLKARIVADLSPKKGSLSLSAHMPDPEVAAQVAQFAADYLQAYVSAYRTHKARVDEAFIRQQMIDAQRTAYGLGSRVGANRDQTRFFSLPSAAVEGQRLAERYELAQRLYTELAREHAKALLAVQTVTPVFSVLEPAQVPDRRSWPRRVWIVLAGAASGLLLGALYWLARRAWGD